MSVSTFCVRKSYHTQGLPDALIRVRNHIFADRNSIMIQTETGVLLFLAACVAALIAGFVWWLKGRNLLNGE